MQIKMQQILLIHCKGSRLHLGTGNSTDTGSDGDSDTDSEDTATDTAERLSCDDVPDCGDTFDV